MSDIAIRVEGIGKKYRIGKKESKELRETFTNFLNHFKPITRNQHQEISNIFWALKDISFEVKQGEAIGIIGSNGAGKSTLLKVLSRITKPTTGRFEINGRVSSLLEVGTGFHPELTGRENIFLNGTILGMRRAEIKAKFDEIMAFSGVEEFIDTPVKHYSSGMKVRLAFSVAAHLEPEILIIDEVLAVGDAEFQKKCLGKMEDVTGEGRTVLFVSHNMGAINQLCTRGLLLGDGELKYQDKSIDKVTQMYLSHFSHSTFNYENLSDDHIEIKSIKFIKKDTIFDIDEDIFLTMEYRVKRKLKNFNISTLIKKYDNIYSISFDVDGNENLLRGREPGIYKYQIKISSGYLPDGFYTLDFGFGFLGEGTIFHLKNALSFQIEHLMSFPRNSSRTRKQEVYIPINWEDD